MVPRNSYVGQDNPQLLRVNEYIARARNQHHPRHVRTDQGSYLLGTHRTNITISHEEQALVARPCRREAAAKAGKVSGVLLGRGAQCQYREEYCQYSPVLRAREVLLHMNACGEKSVIMNRQALCN